MKSKNQTPAGPLAVGGEKPSNFKKTFFRLLDFISPHKYKLVAVIILATLSTIFSIVGPIVTGMATTEISKAVIKNDTIVSGEFSATKLASIIISLAILYFISSIFNFLSGRLMSGVSQTIVYDMRSQVKSKLDRLPLKYFDQTNHGEILSRLTNDMDTIGSTLQQSISQLITSIVTIIGIVVMMLYINPLMTVIVLFTLPVSTIITILISKKSHKYFIKQSRYLSDLSDHIEEMYTGHKLVKVFNHEEDSVEKFYTINNKLQNVGFKAQFMSGIIMPCLNFISNLGYVAVCILGGYFVIRGSLSLGNIQAFIQYMKNFSQPIIQTANISNIIQSTIASSERVFEVLDQEEEISDPKNSEILEDVKGVVSFNNVTFGYSPENILINAMNLQAEKGQTVAIVGPTGAGKTTIVNLLMRFYELNSGTITLDNKDISKLKREDLRKPFAMVLQDSWLFNGTIAENISYSSENATMEEVIEVAKLAHADHFIRTLPHGYDTILDEDASNISQGQKQLLTIARAILAKPSVLILDEATSNVDTRTEVYIQKAMDKLMEGRTSFVIAHRLSTIKNADTIIVMDKGSIIEKGTHEELLANGGFYCSLYNSQFSA